MKAYRTTLVLSALFLAALVAMWGLERSGTLTERERLARADLILPGLLGAAESAISRVEVDRGGEILAFERRPDSSGLWNMVVPKVAAADSGRITALIRNLLALKRSPDSGLLDPARADFGLEHPAATVKLWRSNSDAPAAELEFGKVARDARYVRARGAGGVDVVDPKLFLGLDDPMYSWRERNVMAVPTFQVASATVSNTGGETIVLERGDRGRWDLVKPVATLANPAKVESLLAALAALRVEDGEKGFAADDVKDFAPYGLAPPARTVELKTTRGAGETLALEIGKPLPGNPDRVYVRQRGQDDVVLVAAKPLAELPDDSLAIRSKQIAEFDPKLASEFKVELGGETFAVAKEKDAWRVLKPTPAKADAPTVNQFLTAFAKLEASELFRPGFIKDPRVDQPPGRIVIRQQGREQPLLDLKIGRHDAARRAVYSQLEGDSMVLVIPDQFLAVLPKNEFAYRDLSIMTLNVAEIRQLEIRRGDRVDVLAPRSEGDPNGWLMKKPLAGPADVASVTRALAALAPLRAADFITEKVVDLKSVGLDHPQLEVLWESDARHRLRIGAKVPRATTYYAMLDQGPLIFTLDPESIKPFDGEFHDHKVMSFPADRAARVVLHFAGRTLGLRKRPQPKTPNEWVDEPGQDASGMDLSRVSSIVAALGKLETLRFMQYEGPIPLATGLGRPRLRVDVILGAGEPMKHLRIGDSFGDSVLATTSEGDSGPVFILPGAAWNDLIRSGQKLPPLPANVFAPPR